MSAVEGEIGRLNSVLAMSQGELNTLGDPAATQAMLEDAQTQLAARRQEYDAAHAGAEGLDEANRAMQARFAPALNQRAGEIMSVLPADGMTGSLSTREFEALAEEKEGMLPRRVLTLSRGRRTSSTWRCAWRCANWPSRQKTPSPWCWTTPLPTLMTPGWLWPWTPCGSLARERQILLLLPATAGRGAILPTPMMSTGSFWAPPHWRSEHGALLRMRPCASRSSPVPTL